MKLNGRAAATRGGGHGGAGDRAEVAPARITVGDGGSAEREPATDLLLPPRVDAERWEGVAFGLAVLARATAALVGPQVDRHAHVPDAAESSVTSDRKHQSAAVKHGHPAAYMARGACWNGMDMDMALSNA